ncbi:hypothetical protein [Cyclobacterium plantarum]|uniref:hypothetical protein n=1 Tax=Cyclobacterium plantarum TaxID=2716263 RepID=UPI003F6F2BC9
MDFQNFEGYLFKMVKHECQNYLDTRKNRNFRHVFVDDLQDYLHMDQNDPEK